MTSARLGNSLKHRGGSFAFRTSPAPTPETSIRVVYARHEASPSHASHASISDGKNPYIFFFFLKLQIWKKKSTDVSSVPGKPGQPMLFRP